MEVDEKDTGEGLPVGVPNPWSIEDLNEFLFFCCPQCDHRTKSKPHFLNHALVKHPEVNITRVVVSLLLNLILSLFV